MPTQGGLSVFTPWPPMPLSSPPPLGWLLFPLPRDPPLEPPLSWDAWDEKNYRSPRMSSPSSFLHCPRSSRSCLNHEEGCQSQTENNTLPVLRNNFDQHALDLGALPILSVKIISERLSVKGLCCQWYYIIPSSPMTEQAAQRPIQARSQRQLIRRQPQARSLKLYFWLPHFYVIQSQEMG